MNAHHVFLFVHYKQNSSTFDQRYKFNLNLSKFPHELIHCVDCIENNSTQSKVQINEFGGNADDEKEKTVLNLNDNNCNDEIVKVMFIAFVTTSLKNKMLKISPASEVSSFSIKSKICYFAFFISSINVQEFMVFNKTF